MEVKPLSIDSTKEEVAEFFIKNFKYPNKNKDILIKEDISGSVLIQLSQLEQKSFIALLSCKVVTYLKLRTYLEENKDKFKEKEIKEIITADSQPEEVKQFFDKCLNFQKDLKGLNGKGLIELDEPKMKQLGLNLGQRLKLKKYIEYFKTIIVNVHPKIKLDITKESSEEDVAKFLKTKLKISTESIDSLGLDGNDFVNLKVSEIDNFTSLKEEERLILKKYLSGELIGEDKLESKEEITITNESNEQEVKVFLKQKLDFKDESIEEFDGFDGKTLLGLTDTEIEELNTLSQEEKDKLKDYIENKDTKNIISEEVSEINEKSNEEEILNFIKKKLGVNEINDDLLIKMDVEKISNLKEKEKDILSNFIKEKKNNSNNFNIIENEENQEISENNDFSTDSNNKIEYNPQYIYLYFVIGISVRDYKNHKLYVETHDEEKVCTELDKNYFKMNEETYYQILYFIKAKKNSQYCKIKIFSDKHTKYFECKNNIIYFNNEIIYCILDNLTFNSFKVFQYIRYNDIEPPHLFTQDTCSIFNTFYDYISKSKKKKAQLINHLFLEGLSYLKGINNKYTLTFFLQVLSLGIQNNSNNKDIFSSIINLFNVSNLKRDIFPLNGYHLSNLKEQFEQIKLIYKNQNFKNNENISIKFENLASFYYLALSNVMEAIRFINDSPYKVDIISNIINLLHIFDSHMFVKEFLNFFIINCEKKGNNLNNIISKSLVIVDYIDLIY